MTSHRSRRALLAVVAALGLLLVACGEDDSVTAARDDAEEASQVGGADGEADAGGPGSTSDEASGSEGLGPSGSEGGSAPSGGEQAFGPVTVEGEPLPELGSSSDDPAVGRPAPGLTAETPSGETVTLSPADDGPVILAFVAHWCPHCQAEVPRIVELADDQGAIDGVPVIAVLTASDEGYPNFPPGAWLEEEGWQGEAVVDTTAVEGSVAAEAYGVSGFPFLVAVAADGTVAARASGELGTDGLRSFVAEVAG